MPEFIAAPDLPEDGLGAMLLAMIRQNIEEQPDKIKPFNKLKGRVAIVAPDSEVSATLVFTKGTLTVVPGVQEPNLTVTADSMEILGLSSVPLRMGLPDLFRPEGRDLLSKLKSGEVRIDGMFTHPLLLTRMTMVLSVA